MVWGFGAFFINISVTHVKNACVKANFKHLEKFLKFCCPKAALPMKSINTSDKCLPVFCLSNCLAGLLQLMPSVPCVTASSPSFQTHTAMMSPLLHGLSQNLCPHLFTWESSTTCSFCSRFGATSMLASGHLLKTGKSSIWPCSMQEIIYFSFYPDMEFP